MKSHLIVWKVKAIKSIALGICSHVFIWPLCSKNQPILLLLLTTEYLNKITDCTIDCVIKESKEQPYMGEKLIWK